MCAIPPPLSFDCTFPVYKDDLEVEPNAAAQVFSVSPGFVDPSYNRPLGPYNPFYPPLRCHPEICDPNRTLLNTTVGSLCGPAGCALPSPGKQFLGSTLPPEYGKILPCNSPLGGPPDLPYYPTTIATPLCPPAGPPINYVVPPVPISPCGGPFFVPPRPPFTVESFGCHDRCRRFDHYARPCCGTALHQVNITTCGCCKPHTCPGEHSKGSNHAKSCCKKHTHCHNRDRRSSLRVEDVSEEDGYVSSSPSPEYRRHGRHQKREAERESKKKDDGDSKRKTIEPNVHISTVNVYTTGPIIPNHDGDTIDPSLGSSSSSSSCESISGKEPNRKAKESPANDSTAYMEYEDSTLREGSEYPPSPISSFHAPHTSNHDIRQKKSKNNKHHDSKKKHNEIAGTLRFQVPVRIKLGESD